MHLYPSSTPTAWASWDSVRNSPLSIASIQACTLAMATAQESGAVFVGSMGQNDEVFQT